MIMRSHCLQGGPVLWITWQGAVSHPPIESMNTQVHTGGKGFFSVSAAKIWSRTNQPVLAAGSGGGFVWRAGPRALPIIHQAVEFPPAGWWLLFSPLHTAGNPWGPSSMSSAVAHSSPGALTTAGERFWRFPLPSHCSSQGTFWDRNKPWAQQFHNVVIFSSFSRYPYKKPMQPRERELDPVLSCT